MTFINMLSPWQWALLAAVPPAIVLLYFLKLKRTPLVVPSTYLWHKSLEDLHVNSIWQRLRTSLLLLLQILLVLLVMAALLRPGWSGTRLVGNRFIFLIDNSASISATDESPTRLELAKQRAEQLIGQMASGDVAMIVSFSDTARVEQPFTDSRRVLSKQLAGIRPTTRQTSLAEALRVAAGLAQAEQASAAAGGESPGNDTAPASLAATLYLFSDGRFADVEKARLGQLKPIYIPIGNPEAKNLGVTAFNLRRREGHTDQLQAFARLENFGPQTLKAEVDLYHDENLLDSRSVELKARDAEGVVFDLGNLQTGVLRLQARAGDDLLADDQAWASIDPPKRGRVLLVTPGNDALALTLKTDSARELVDVELAGPAILNTPAYQQQAAAGNWSFIIYDQCQPRELPQANTLFIGRLPPGDGWKGASVDAPQIIDVDSTHPLLQLIDLGNVHFVQGLSLQAPEGARTLISTEAGPLLAIAPRGVYEDAVLGAEIVGTDEKGERTANTDWPLRVSFPVFALNALNYFCQAPGLGAASIEPGQTVSLRGGGASNRISVRAPDGRQVELERGQGEAFHFAQTDQLGAYRVEEQGQPARFFAVNLFDPQESTLAPRPTVELGSTELAGQATWEGGRFELWKLVLLAVLGVLCLEWYIYNRRVYL